MGFIKGAVKGNWQKDTLPQRMDNKRSRNERLPEYSANLTHRNESPSNEINEEMKTEIETLLKALGEL